MVCLILQSELLVNELKDSEEHHVHFQKHLSAHLDQLSRIGLIPEGTKGIQLLNAKIKLVGIENELTR